MTNTSTLSFERVLDLLADKLADPLCQEPASTYPRLSTIRERVQLFMDRRPCIAPAFALSLCGKCGRAISGAVHAPKDFTGVYCAGCCPCCAIEPGVEE